MEFYNAIAKSYHELHGEEQKQKFEFINNLVPIKGRVLDLGCGDCQLASLYELEYFGVEPSQSLVLESKFKDCFDLNNIQLCKAENMVLKGEFDLILCVTVAHHFSDLKTVFLKVLNSLKKEGVFVLSILKNSPSKNKIVTELNEFFEIFEHNQGKDIVFICKGKL
jgi:SAM-dependent methyltransferase